MIFARLRALFNRQTRPVPQALLPNLTIRGMYQLSGCVVTLEYGVFSAADFPDSGIPEEGDWSITWEDGYAYCSKLHCIDNETAAARLVGPPKHEWAVKS